MPTTVATTRGKTATISDGDLDELRAQVRGPVSTPSDGTPARAQFNAMHPGDPALTIGCTSTADVVAAVNFARARDLLVAVRGGGHSIAGLSSVDGGVLIDLAAMHGVHVDPAARVAHVQGGAVWADVDHEAQTFGLATPGGVVSDTGVAGLTLGGGYGWLRRKHGLSCDNLLEAQIVCADGTVRTASADENPDLYWGIRGGGGNFGIATSFTFGLHEVGPTVAFAATFYPVEQISDILRKWRDYVAEAPDEVTSVVVTITFPADPHAPEAVHNRACAIVGGVYAGDVDEGMKRMQPLREFGTVLFDMSGPTPFTAVQAGFDPLFPRDTLQAYWKSQYLDELPDAAIDLIATKAQERPAPLTLVNTFHMGGAINTVDPEATAFAERSAPFMVSIDGMWDDAADNEKNVAWVRDAWEDIKKFGNGSVYLNFTGLADEPQDAGVDDAFGRNLRRLAKVKATYDPDNFFRLNNNVAPKK
jgi:FAD/FMN-containing dehydrogenase